MTTTELNLNRERIQEIKNDPNCPIRKQVIPSIEKIVSLGREVAE